MRTLIIINPAAAKARSAWSTIKRQLNALGVIHETCTTAAPGDASTQTRVALRSGIDTVVVEGGDGTLSEVAEGFLEIKQDLDLPPEAINPSATLAVHPAGKDEAILRDLLGNRDPLQDRLKRRK